MAVPNWECLLEAAIVAWLPWDVGRGRRDRNVDVFGGVRACACREWTLLKQTPENRHSDTNTNTDDGSRDFVLDLDDDIENFRQKINRLTGFLLVLQIKTSDYNFT